MVNRYGLVRERFASRLVGLGSQNRCAVAPGRCCELQDLVMKSVSQLARGLPNIAFDIAIDPTLPHDGSDFIRTVVVMG